MSSRLPSPENLSSKLPTLLNTRSRLALTQVCNLAINLLALANKNLAFFREQKGADAAAYKVKIQAEASLLAASKDAEAKLIRQQKEAEGELVQQQKKAAGLSAMAHAYGDLAQAFGGPAGLIQYLMIERGVYTDLAKANAEAVRGLNPKMTIWNTGAQAGSEGHADGAGMGGMDSIRNMYQMLPPLMSTINEQTGIVLPEWQFGKLAGQISEREVSGKPINSINGHKK
jgi:flotillin